MSKLSEIADVLDMKLGDTDPHIEEDWTDEEIKTEYPIFWACRALYKYIKDNPNAN